MGARERRHAALAVDANLSRRATATVDVAILSHRTHAPIALAPELAGALPAIDPLLATAADWNHAAFSPEGGAGARLAAALEALPPGSADFAFATGRAVHDTVTTVRKRAAFDVDTKGPKLRDHVVAARRLADELRLFGIVAATVAVPAEMARGAIRWADTRENSIRNAQPAAGESQRNRKK